jgi:hypothetical protein
MRPPDPIDVLEGVQPFTAVNGQPFLAVRDFSAGATPCQSLVGCGLTHRRTRASSCLPIHQLVSAAKRVSGG